MNGSTSSDFRTVRGYQLASRREGQLTPAQEDYLEMTYRLCMKNNYARVGKLSELLHVKPPSASKMIFKLAALGYLNYDRYEIIQMTDIGWEIGQYLFKRHEAVERFLKLIGNPNPLKETELIEHSLSPSTVSAITTLVEFFQSDPAAQKNYEEYKRAKEGKLSMME